MAELRTQREALGLSQRQLAERVHIPQSHYSRVESAAVNPRLESIIEIARVLELELVLVPRHVLPAVEALIRATRAARNEAGETASAQPTTAQSPAYSLDTDIHESDADDDDGWSGGELR